MPTTVIMKTSRPDGAGGTYKQGSPYTLADDLAAYFLSIGAAKRTSTRSEQTGAAISGNAAGQFPSAPALSSQVPVTASTTSSGGVAFAGPQVFQGLQYQGTKAPIPVIGGSTLAASDMTLVSGSGAVTLITRRGIPCLQIDIPAGAGNAQFRVNRGNGALFGGDLYLGLEGGYHTGLLKIEAYHGPGAALAPNYTMQGAMSFLAPRAVDNWQDQGGVWTWRSGRKNVGITGSITWPFVVGDNKIVFTPQAGQAATVYLYAVGYGQPRKGRLIITAADGERSWFTTGAPIYNSRGINVGACIIPSGLDKNYAPLAQVQAFVASGNAVFAHGPNLSSYSGNIVVNYANNADRIADLESAREYIFKNGLHTPGQEMCYSWPQGAYQAEAGDTSLLDAAYAVGFRLAQTASVINPIVPFVLEGATRLNRMALPYTTHSWAGSTAAQVAYNQAVVDSINNAATYGTDVFLAHHQIVPDSTPDGSMDTIKCRVSDVAAFADAAKAQVDAGKLIATTLPQLAMEMQAGGFWGNLY